MDRDPGLLGPSNFRDLGGYPTATGQHVRWRRVFRSDALRFSEADVAIVRDVLHLRTVIDLRTAMEYGNRDGGGNPTYVERLAEVGARRVHLAMIDETRMAKQVSDERPPAARGYLKMFERGAAALNEALQLIADPANQPVVFHCAAGKDRTGIMAAVVLGLLGVDDETIVADYAVSQANMARALKQIQARPDADRILANRPLAAFQAPTEAVVGFLQALHSTYGQWGDAVAAVGIDQSTVARLRLHLLEE